MNHYPFNPTPFQRANLMRLEAHLALGVTNYGFDMGDFYEEDPECGTVACACGHGPSLGIEKLPGQDWRKYASHAFGARSDRAFDWIFGGLWAITDNTPQGAAARIRCALKHGIPENAQSQAFGGAPLSYTIPNPVETQPVRVSEPAT